MMLGLEGVIVLHKGYLSNLPYASNLWTGNN